MFRSGSRRSAISRTHASPTSPGSCSDAPARRWPDYQSLWQWSVDDPAAFWGALWEYFELGDPPDRVLDNQEMPGARWFPGVRLNYVDQIVRNARTDRPAILHVSEDGQITELSWHELLGRTQHSRRRCVHTG